MFSIKKIILILSTLAIVILFVVVKLKSTLVFNDPDILILVKSHSVKFVFFDLGLNNGDSVLKFLKLNSQSWYFLLLFNPSLDQIIKFLCLFNTTRRLRRWRALLF